jgi:hypothetical protein
MVITTKLKDIDFKYFPIGLVVLYVPFHLLEEAIFNFPLWMYGHYNLPKPLSYPHWLINNSLFFITLLIGLLIFFKDKSKFLLFGFGILIWGFMNSMEHIVFSILDYKLSPGFYTSLLFLFIFILGFLKLFQTGILNKILFFKSIGIALIYWIVPFIFIILMGSVLINIFP